MRWLIGVGMGLALGGAATSAEPRRTAARPEGAIEIQLSSRVAMAPASVRSLIRIAPHQDNRTLRVELDAPDFFRSSDVELEGDLAARSHFFAWRSLPAGSYTLVVTVLGAAGPRAVRQLPFDVVGSSPGLER